MSERNLLQYRVNRDLLNPNFEGYKLSLDSIPVKSQKLSRAICRRQICQSQYSLLHQHLFVTHNFLTFDDYLLESNANILQAFVVLEDNTVYGLNFFKDTSEFDVFKVFELNVPSVKGLERECYNATISLPSLCFALISDGYGTLWLCDRRERFFKTLFTTSDLLDGKSFTIVDSVEKFIDQETGSIVECLIKSVLESDTKPESFVNRFLWVTFGQDNNEWKILRTRSINVKKVVNYSSLSRSITASTICLLNSGSVDFVDDSAKPVRKSASDITNGPPRKSYTWHQTDDEITVKAEVGPKVSKDNVAFSLEADKIGISILGDETAILSGELYASCSVDASHWSLEDNGLLVVRLAKQEKGVNWTEVVKGDLSGEYIADSELIKTMSNRLMDFTTEEEIMEPFSSRPAFNAEDIEECDAAPVDALTLTWLDGESHEVLRTVDMGGHQWLFSARIRPNEPLYLGMRFDVDGILWRIPSDPLEPVINDGSPLSAHSVTFDAFGYVEAAKESRRFVSCSPGAVYAVIADQRRNVYVYWRNQNVPGELKNRKTGKLIQTVCKQTLLTVDADQEILGLSAMDDFLMLLTDSHVHVFTFNASDTN